MNMVPKTKVTKSVMPNIMPRCEKKTYQKIIQLMADFDTLINFKVRFYISMAIELLI